MEDKNKQTRSLEKVSHLFLSGRKPPQEKITIHVAAKTLGVSRGTVVSYLDNGLLTRIRQADGIYISVDEIRALRDKKRGPDSAVSKDVSSDRGNRSVVTIDIDDYEGLLTRIGQLENERRYLLQYKADLQAKDKQLQTLKSELDNLKQAFEAASSQFETRTRLLLEEELKHLSRPWWRTIFGGRRVFF